MKSFKIVSSALVAFAISGGGLMADAHGNEFVHSRTNNGQVYVMFQTHMSLYTYENDGVGVSNCYGACAKSWPPAILPAGTPLGKSYTLIKRNDGSLQAAFRGQPLYLSVLDNAIGETNGDGVGNVWFLARPDF